MADIAFLADHTETIPDLIDCFRAQWPAYFAARTAADIENGFYTEAHRDGLPVRLVALIDGELAGTICLREHATHTLPAYRPGLGGLLVIERYRGRGIGTELVSAGMTLAQTQGHAMVFATTVAARGILERLDWKQVRNVWHDSEHLVLYAYDIRASGNSRT